MARYRVRFIKILCDSTGHPHECLEGEVDIRRARDSARALKAAKRRFERMKRIPRWDHYADTFELVPSDEATAAPAGRALIRHS